MVTKIRIGVLAIISVIILSSCGASSIYDHFTYTKTLETKLETLSLMDKSTTSYKDHKDEVTDLKNQIQMMVEYEQGKDKNEFTQKMWEVLGNENKLVGSYLNLWEAKDSLSPALIPEAKGQIEEAFNLLIEYELKKDKANQNVLLDFINNL